MSALLDIANLNVHFALADGDVHAVKNASLIIQEGECLGVVGESGSGKSQLFLAAFGLLAAMAGHRQRDVSRRRIGRVSKTPQRAARRRRHHDLPRPAILTPHADRCAGHGSPMLHRNVSRGEAKPVPASWDRVRTPESARRRSNIPITLAACASG